MAQARLLLHGLRVVFPITVLGVAEVAAGHPLLPLRLPQYFPRHSHPIEKNFASIPTPTEVTKGRQNSRHRTSPVVHDAQSHPDHPSSRHFLRSIGPLNQP